MAKVLNKVLDSQAATQRAEKAAQTPKTEQEAKDQVRAFVERRRASMEALAKL